MEASIVKYQNIDKVKWDIVNNSTKEHAIIYNSVAYLDTIAQQWDAIIIGDYEACLALPYITKWGIKLYANPPFLQKMAVIGNCTQENCNRIFKVLSKLRLVNIKLENHYSAAALIATLQNFTIDLATPYSAIYNAYAYKHKYIVRKAQANNLEIIGVKHIDAILQQNRISFGHLNHYTDAHFSKLVSFVNNNPANFEAYHVLNENAEMVYGAVIIKDNYRYYYLVSGAKRNDKSNAPTFFLDWFLKEKAGQAGKIFDFEGSSIDTVANFFKKFGPQKEYYYAYYINNWKFPVKQLINKKLKY